jgi:hypothetical protein
MSDDSWRHPSTSEESELVIVRTIWRGVLLHILKVLNPRLADLETTPKRQRSVIAPPRNRQIPYGRLCFQVSHRAEAFAQCYEI